MSEDILVVDQEKARQFLEELRHSIELKAVADLVGLDHEQLRAEVDMSLAEAMQTISLLHGLEFKRGDNALEVGAGFGFASLALASFGYNVTALEPGGTGFEKNRTLAAHFFSISGLSVHYVGETVEKADFSNRPAFDLIISNNVLEHINNVFAGLSNLAAALGSDGLMIHSCPNYVFPYEPHFGIPLVPLKPRWTSRILPGNIASSDLWKSLNFISVKEVTAVAGANDLYVAFERGTMFTSISRLNSDAEFASRHNVLAQIARSRFLMAAARRILTLPVAIATPMNFVLSRDFPDLAWSRRRWVVRTPRL